MNRTLLALLLILLGGVLLRLAVLKDLLVHPSMVQPYLDAEIYVRWAAEIAKGDFWGEGIFYQAPGYPYLMGLFFRFFGVRPEGWIAVQYIVSLGTVAVVFLLARDLFNRKTALLAAALMATYPVLAYYDQLFLKTSVSVFLGTASLYLVYKLWSRPSSSFLRYAAAGGVIGCAALVRETYLLFGAGGLILFGIACPKTLPGKPAWIRIGSFLAGCLLVVGLCTFRNLVRTGEWVLITHQGGANFFVGNNPATDGTTLLAPRESGIRAFPERGYKDFQRRAEEASGRSLSPSEVSRYWWIQGLRFIREHPGKYLRLLGKKWTYIWTNLEISDNYNYRVFRSHTPALRAIPLGFGILLGLFLIGLVRVLNRKKEFAPLFLYVGVHILSFLGFLVNSRYRMDLVPAMIVIGAGGLATAPPVSILRRAALAALFLAGVAYSHLPGYQPDPAELVYSRALIDLQEGRQQESLAGLRKTVEVNPRHYLAWGLLGYTALGRGELEEAARDLTRSLAIEPNNPLALNACGTAFARLGENRRAEEMFRSAVRLDPEAIEPRRNLGLLFISMHQTDRALEILNPLVGKDRTAAQMVADLRKGRPPDTFVKR